MKRVLILGAGLVAPPMVRYFLAHRDVRLTVAAADLSRVAPLIDNAPDRAAALTLDATRPGALAPLLADADVAISLLPAVQLGSICEAAIAARVPLVSTSYQPPNIEDLDRKAKAAGIVLLNETGFDPGIDHMLASATIRKVRQAGGAVETYMSAAGGFPAPDANNNPWGYKFSWSPRGAILAGRNEARYLRGGEVVAIAGPNLFRHFWPYEIEGQGIFEIYPNRDSLVYRDRYALADATGVFRGTIRYPGWCETMRAAVDLGLFDPEPMAGRPEARYVDLLLRNLPVRSGSLVERVASFLGVECDSAVITRLEWAGFFSDRPLPPGPASPLDLFAGRLEKLMQYQPGERDMAVLQHSVTARFPDGHRETISGGVTAIGIPWGDTAMSRLVSFPAAIAARMILDGTIRVTGAVIPTAREIYVPVLDELAERGVQFHERSVRTYPGPI